MNGLNYGWLNYTILFHFYNKKLTEDSMRVKIWGALSLFFISMTSNAFQCPSIVTGSTLVHSLAGQPWVLQDINAINQGWYVIQNPPVNNRREMTVLYTSNLNVFLNADDKGNFFAICAYDIGSGNDMATVQLSMNKIQGLPSNTNFSKVNENSYVCKTKANRPDLCASLDIWQRPVRFN